MMWFVERVASGEVGSASRKNLLLAACACARTVLHLVSPGEDRRRLAIEAAEDYARGGPTTLEQVGSAATSASASAATATATAATASASAAATRNATYAATYVATVAASAAASASAAQCADIVRQHYPQVPELP